MKEQKLSKLSKMNKMVITMQKGKNVSQIIVVILISFLIHNDLFGQNQKDQVHKDFLRLVDSDEKYPIYYQIIQDEEWLLSLSDSQKVENLIRGGCRIKDLDEAFENFNFEMLLEEEGHFRYEGKWEKKKLPDLKIKNRIPQNGNYAQYSVPFFSGDWAIIRRQYFENKELLEDSILVFKKENKERYNRVCQLFLSLRFPHYN